jgi:ribosomal protein S14
VTAMIWDVCSDCGKQRLITLKFKAAATVEVDGIATRMLVDVKLCRGCMRKRAQAMKKTQ